MCGEHPLDGDWLAAFEALEVWHLATGSARAVAVERARAVALRLVAVPQLPVCHGAMGQSDAVTLAYPDLVDALRGAVPEFGPNIDEHDAFYKERLPHVLFGDFTRFVLDAVERGEQDVVDRSLDFLDGALRDGDDEAQNVVSVSFVENVGPGDESAQPFMRTWPSALRREAERQQRA